ncbi:glycosyltransferase family 32 protein [Roseateles sp. GG27B]
MSWQLLTTLLLALLAVAATLLAWEMLQILFAQAPRKVATVRVAPAADAAPIASGTAAIPKIIWSYWHQTPVPEFVALCQANWTRFAPDHEVRMLSQDSIQTWLASAELNSQFDTLPPYRQADWLRLQLLAQHGGLWIDASTILTQSLAWVHQQQQAQQVEYIGFYIDRFTQKPEQPIVENWFMAAVPGSAFVTDLAREFNRALYLGETPYLAELQAQGLLEQVSQGLGPKDRQYLIMHVAAAVVLDRAAANYRLFLSRAEDTAFAFHTALRWRKRHLYARLGLTPCPRHLPMLIKLRGGDRRVVEQGMARGWLYRGSLLAKYLRPPHY